MSNTNTNDPGEAAVPAGFRLGYGWGFLVPPQSECPRHGQAIVYQNLPKTDCACTVECAKAIGALVPIEPPVAEPTRPVCQCRNSAFDGGGICGSPLRTGQIDRCTFCALACNPPPVAEPAWRAGQVRLIKMPIESTFSAPLTLVEPLGNGWWKVKDVPGKTFEALETWESHLLPPSPLNPPHVPPGPHVVIATVDATERTAPENITLFVPPGPVPPEGEPFFVGLLKHYAEEERPAAPAKAPLSEVFVELRRGGYDDEEELVRAHIAALESQLARREADEDALRRALSKARDQLATAIRERDEWEREALWRAKASDEQRGRAESGAKAHEADWQEAYAARLAEAAKLLAETSRADLLQRHADDLRARLVGPFAAGWSKGAEATREACARGEEYRAHLCAAPCDHHVCKEARVTAVRIRALPIPVCPEGPPAGTRCGNLDCGPNCTHGMSLVCGHDDEDSECNNQRCAQADAGTGAVTSGEAAPTQVALSEQMRGCPLDVVSGKWADRAAILESRLAAANVRAGEAEKFPPLDPGREFIPGLSDKVAKLTDQVRVAEKTNRADAIKAAVAGERERCLAWAKDCSVMWAATVQGIASGADAPGAGKP